MEKYCALCTHVEMNSKSYYKRGTDIHPEPEQTQTHHSDKNIPASISLGKTNIYYYIILSCWLEIEAFMGWVKFVIDQKKQLK